MSQDAAICEISLFSYRLMMPNLSRACSSSVSSRSSISGVNLSAIMLLPALMMLVVTGSMALKIPYIFQASL